METPIFIPTTREIDIGENVVYRPTRCWLSGTYAGENLRSVNGDGSGCAHEGIINGRIELICRPPYCVVARRYWNRGRPRVFVDAYLYYPSGIVNLPEYCWEVLGLGVRLQTGACIGDIQRRFIGEHAEADMEEMIRSMLGGDF